MTRALFPEWMADAPCASVDPALWFPPKGGSTREAKRICATCDVKAQCLAWAVAENIPDGVFGGVTARERRIAKAEERAA
jgi:WhiB family redox-sensing transcriptional regulator